MKSLIAVMAFSLLWSAGTVCAQEAPLPVPPRQQRGVEALKSFLDLTERQFNELQDVQTAYRAKVQEISQRMRDLDRQRREAMQASGADPTRIGSMALEIQGLQQQLQEEQRVYRENARSILTAAQREKVDQVEEAMKLMQYSGALAAYGLLQAPGRGALGGAVVGGGMPGMMMRGEMPAPPAQGPQQ
jgi:Spy/CpxP family protein refolding chaperone